MSFLRYGLLKAAHKLAWRSIAGCRQLYLKHVQPAKTYGRSAYGINLWHRWDDRTFVYCYGGIYGRALSGMISARDTDFVFVDIGANQGLYSLIAARNRRCLAVFAFEPVPATYAALLDNISINPQAGKIDALECGISDQAGSAEMLVPTQHSGAATLRGSSLPEGHERVRIELVSAQELNDLLVGEAPLIVKIDVEGHEEVVIEQILSCAHAHRIDCIVYEIDLRWSDAAQIEARLRAAGFDRFQRIGRGRHFDVIARRAGAAT